MIGVPGLLQAARARKVVIGNALGSGLVESDAFLSFLPGLSRYFFDEDLALPSVATWWCGQPREREYVLGHLDELVVRRISSARSLFGSGQGSLVTPETTADERERSSTRSSAAATTSSVRSPRRCRSRPPGPGASSLTAAPITLRVYVAATDKGYEVMPGGLTRIAVGSDPRAQWLEAGDVSKDTWVLSDQPVEQFSLLAQRQASQRLHRGGRDLPSRTADNLFWLGRYTERAEGAVRLATQPRDPARRRDGLDAQHRLARARRVDADRAEALVRAPRPARDAGGPRGGAARALERAVRPRKPRRPRDRARQRAAQRGGRARASVVRHLQDPARPYGGRAFVGALAGPRDRRRAAAPEPADPVPRRVQRHGDGEHDARLTAGASSTWAGGSSGCAR